MTQEQSEATVKAEQNGSGDVKENVGKNDWRIVKQIEYYFGDINLPRDRFLMAEVKKGWVPVDVMLKFNRLAQITKDVDEITNAISNLSTLMEVNQQKDAIRRRPDHPLPENTLEYWLGVKKRTAYVKGFPLTSTIDELLAFFQTKGDIENVLMRKTKVGEPRVFKGSVFVTFSSEEEAKKFADPTEPLTYKDQPLEKCMQEQYWANKNKENKEKKAEQRALKAAKNAEVAKDQLESLTAAHYVKGIVLKITGMPTTVSINAAKEFFGKFERVAFVKLNNEDNTAFVRFDSHKVNAAEEAWKKAVADSKDGTVLMRLDGEDAMSYELTAEVLTGDEESAYWVDFNNRKLQIKNEFKKKGKDRGQRDQHGQKGGKQRGSRKRGLSGGDGGEAPKSKRIVFDDNGNPIEPESLATVDASEDADAKPAGKADEEAADVEE